MRVIDFTTDMVRVQFENYHKQYTFRLPKELVGNVDVGDVVVVQCKDEHLALATVVETNASVPTGVELSWVICKVYLHEAQRRKEVAKRKAYLMERLEAKKRELEDRAVWEMLAAKDSEAADMLKELETLCE